MRAALLLVVLCAACASPRLPVDYESPILAYPIDGDLLKRREVIEAFASLVRNSGYCRMPFESAGFLVLDEDDRFRVIPWPRTYRYHNEQWSGAIPPRTVAIAHTHPLRSPEPSAQDREDAVQLGVPIFVLTTDSVVLIRARDGSSIHLIDRNWLTD